MVDLLTRFFSTALERGRRGGRSGGLLLCVIKRVVVKQHTIVVTSFIIFIFKLQF
jgi:hypothetical protein